MSLPTERWCVSIKPRTKQIDPILKEKLSPYGATRSARFQFAYELAFAIVCGDNTNEIVRAILDGWQQANGIKKSYQEFPAVPTKAGEEGLFTTGDVLSPFHKFRASRPFRAALVQEAVAEASFLAPFSRGTHAVARVA